MNERRDHMRLEKKIPIGRLHVIRTADAANFIGKSALIFRRGEMFDDRIAEDLKWSRAARMA
jgi:hypothetical protein